MSADRWNARYAAAAYVYGTAPNAFVAAEGHRFSPHAKVADLGAGEGRNAVFLATLGHRVTAVDTAEAGLEKVRRLAAAQGVVVETALADVLTWTPEAPLDGIVMAYLHLPSVQRPALYRHVEAIVRPGGLVLGEWFRPEQRSGSYPSGGPPDPDLLVTEAELRAAFEPEGLLHLESAETVLNEGEGHRGKAAVVRLVWRRPQP